MKRVMNFSAGPSALPLPVLERAGAEFCSYQNMGFGIMEVSHRGKVFDAIHNGAIAKIREFYNVGEEYAVLFLQGGASLQFAQIPMNLHSGTGTAEYANTGVWTKKAIKEAATLGLDHKIIASSEQSGFDHIPSGWEFSSAAEYGYICSNNTIYGTQYSTLPSPKCPLVVDSSSDLLSRPVDFAAHNIGLFYGGAQKNAGIAGVTLVVVKKELADRVGKSGLKVPLAMRYNTQIEANSLANTPCSFGIYIFDLVLDWIKSQGGLAAVEAANNQKAALLYGAIDGSSFYKGHARADSRSKMNVSFFSPSAELDAKFVAEAESEGMIGLKGHRILGGLRASIYNAVTLQEVEALVAFMREFERKNG